MEAAAAAGEVRRLQGGRGAGSGEGRERGYVERNGKGKENEGGTGKRKKSIDRKLLELRSPVDSASRLLGPVVKPVSLARTGA